MSYLRLSRITGRSPRTQGGPDTIGGVRVPKAQEASGAGPPDPTGRSDRSNGLVSFRDPDTGDGVRAIRVVVTPIPRRRRPAAMACEQFSSRWKRIVRGIGLPRLEFLED